MDETENHLVERLSADEANVLEALGRLHSIEVERFFERRRLEWRLAFTLWAGLAVTGALVLDNLNKRSATLIEWAVAIGFASVPVFHFVFARRAIVPGAIDGRDRGYVMTNLARTKLGLSPARPLHDEYRRFSAHYWLVAVTGVLSGTVVLLLAAITENLWLLAILLGELAALSLVALLLPDRPRSMRADA